MRAFKEKAWAYQICGRCFGEAKPKYTAIEDSNASGMMKNGRLPEAFAGRSFHYFRGWLGCMRGGLGRVCGLRMDSIPSGKARRACAEADLKLKG
ncbi:MAG: hypothetical protein LBU32_02040 [Clostridiales bacterium]|nr:hypothetical protein [Clostridiales bacterium]